jgi:hypothetical protein
MTVPSTSLLNMWDGTPFTNTDRDGDNTTLVSFLASGNYDVTFNSVTANSFSGLPTETFTLTAGEDLTAGDVVRISAGQALKATNASKAGITSVVGVASETITSGNNIKIAYTNYDGFTGLTLGTTYYVGVDGAVTATKPSFGMEIGTAVSTSRINIDIKEPKYVDVLDTKNIFVPETSFNTTELKFASSVIRSNSTNAGSVPNTWSTQPIIDGAQKVYMVVTLEGSGSGGDGFQMFIRNEAGTNLYISNSIIIGNPSQQLIISFDLADSSNNLALNIGSTPLNGLTGVSDSAGRWRLLVQRSAGSSTSGAYVIKKVDFLLVEQ